jgi:N4-gp56 family major capsid protein
MSGPTKIPFGSPLAIKKWSGSLGIQVSQKSYFDKRFVGTSDNHVIQKLTELESEAGDTIQFDLSMQLRNKPTAGDRRLEGKEEALRFFSDNILIDQLRHGVSSGGKMSRKRTLHDLRKVSEARLSDYWAELTDQYMMMYLAGARGVNLEFKEDLNWTGHAGNAMQSPDPDHLLLAGAAVSKATMVAADRMNKVVIERAITKARMLRANNTNLTNLQPVMLDGEPHFVCLMSPYQEYDMKNFDTTGWMDIQKAALTAQGKDNPIFKGGLGMINNCVLHSHESVIRFNDYGAGANLNASRALFMGRQAGAVAFGTTKGFTWDWTEETKDHGNEKVVAAGTIFGIKKVRFNGSDFGCMAIDTIAAIPA